MNKKTRIAVIALAAALVLGAVAFAVLRKPAKKPLAYSPGPYSDEQLDRIYQETTVQKKSLSELQEICDVKYLDKDAPQAIAVVAGDSQVLVFRYEEDGTLISEEIHPLSPSSQSFEALEVSAPITNVMSIDPDADYGFLYSGRNDLERNSFHYTSDGYCVVVSYDSNNNIVSVEKKALDD